MKGHRSTFSLFPYTTLFRSPVGANRTTCITRDQILYAQQVGGPLPHHLAALAQKIAYRPLFFRIDVALRQNSQPQNVGKPASVGMIVSVLQSLVLLDRSRVGQMNAMSLVHQAVDQPVPVEGRLHDNALEHIPIARKLL